MTDAGLVTFSEMLENLNYVCDAVDVPVIADADTGYGNAVNVTRTVRAYEKAGAAATHRGPGVPEEVRLLRRG
ncbi:MAG: isocitrate lyase/phosphoenolpyruvate mutase family protein [Dehalococcoidia bacterium]